MMPNEFYLVTLPKLAELVVNAITSFDETKYVGAIKDLSGNEPTSSELDAQVKIILDAQDISTKEKLSFLKDVSAQREMIRDNELKRNDASANIIDRGIERRANAYLKVFGGICSGGLSLLPDAVRYIRKELQDEIVIVPDHRF